MLFIFIKQYNILYYYYTTILNGYRGVIDRLRGSPRICQVKGSFIYRDFNFYAFSFIDLELACIQKD